MVSRLPCCARQVSLRQCLFRDRFRLFGCLDFHVEPIDRQFFVAVRKGNVALHWPSCAESAVEKMSRSAIVCPSDAISSCCCNKEACLLFLKKLYLRGGLNLVSQMDVLESWQ